MMTPCALALVSAIVALQPPCAQSSAARDDTVHVVLVVDDTAAERSLVRGVTLGAEEAVHTGALFGTALTLRVVARTSFDSAQGSVAPSIYVVAGDAPLCSEVMQRSRRTATPVLDAGCPITSGPPAPNVYSLDPRSDTAMAADSTRIELWHASLERFGAAQLNERFRRRFAGPMDSDAWMGWFSVKIALDLALHAHSASGADLLQQLADPHPAFDGQKGRPLRFDAATHRLNQPLYRIAGSGDSAHVVAELAP